MTTIPLGVSTPLAQPDAFRRETGAYRPAEQAVPVYNAVVHVPPTPPMPTLSITRRGVLHLHASLFRRLGLCYGQPINLVPPVYGSLFWHLDLRPTAAQRVECYDDMRARARGVKLPPDLVDTTLILHLLPGEPAYQHYYPLLPENAFTPKAP